MTPILTGPSMSQKIFSMSLDVETVSLYLLCCAVADTGSIVTKEVLMDKWNGTPETLARELDRLRKKNILDLKKAEENEIYRIIDEKDWG